MERRQRERARFRARFGAQLTAEELPSSGVVVRIAKSGSVNGGAIREGRGAAALNEERQREEGLHGGEEWLRGGAPARRSGCVEERSREENLRWPCGAGVERLRDACAEEWLRGGAAARGEPAMLCGGRAVLVWCGGRAVLVWCGVVWCGGWERRAKRMQRE